MKDFDKAINEAKAAIMPFESWERLPGENAKAFAAFCAFRDFGPERNIINAVDSTVKDVGVRAKRYRSWRKWCSQYHWRERAVDFDRYIENLKQEELRKTIEAQGEMHRKVTGKMLDVVSKKLDTMDPEELTQGNVTEWVQTAIKADREAIGNVIPGNSAESKQGQLNFVADFQGI